MYRGYFPLWRKIQDHAFYLEPREFSKYEAWIDLLMAAKYDEVEKQVVICMKALNCDYGECLVSVREWARRWRWSHAKVRRFLNLLEKMGQIETESEGLATRIKIVNFEQYDPKRHSNDPQSIHDRSTIDPQAATFKKDKKDKKVKNVLSPPTPPRGACALPAEFAISDGMRAWYQAQGFRFIEIETATQEFVDYWRSNGKRMRDWEAAWRNGMRKAEEWAAEKVGKKSGAAGRMQRNLQAAKTAEQILFGGGE